VVGVLLAGALPIAASAWRTPPDGRCAYDGAGIDARYRARLTTADGRVEWFCCPTCLGRRLARPGTAARAVAVTAEDTGEMLEPARAWFVRSEVVTAPSCGNDLHVFATEGAARAHARAFHGRVLAERGESGLLQAGDGRHEADGGGHGEGRHGN
jgi:hypothetical protein